MEGSPFCAGLAVLRGLAVGRRVGLLGLALLGFAATALTRQPEGDPVGGSGLSASGVR